VSIKPSLYSAAPVLLSFLLVSGCGPTFHSGAPPVVYCGQTVFESAFGIYEHSVPSAGSLVVPAGWLHSSQGSPPIALQFTSSCSAGTAVTVQRGGLVRLASEAVASDGSPVGALVYGVSPGTTVLTVISYRSTSKVVLIVEP
jgi:hypothetical protein